MLSTVLQHLNYITKAQNSSLNVFLSQILGYASISIWICVFIPQLHENYINQSSESISLAFLLLWACGDVLNLIGSVAQGLITSAIMLAIYYIVSDFFLISQVLYYRYKEPPVTKKRESFYSYQESSSLRRASKASSLRRASKTSFYGALMNPEGVIEFTAPTYSPGFIIAVKATIALLSFVIPFCALLSSFNSQALDIPVHPTLKEEVVWWAAILGWISTFLFCLAKVPQIYLNYYRKATDGLSATMFVFCCLGNITYIMSILVFSLERTYLICNLPWLMGAILPILFDCTILAQFLWYRSPSPSTIQAS